MPRSYATDLLTDGPVGQVIGIGAPSRCWALAAAETGSVMNLRGFGGQHIAIGIFTLLSSRSRDLARPALLLNGGIGVCDMVAGRYSNPAVSQEGAELHRLADRLRRRPPT